MAKNFLAHISEDGREQSVLAHLEGTATLSGTFAKKFGAEEQGRLIGLAHDIGKCSDAFQARLFGGPRVDHSTAGAIECGKLDMLWAAVCVAGHHSGLPDVGNCHDTGESTLYGRIKRALGGAIPTYETPVALPNVAPPPRYGKDYLTDSFLIRMLYSCLVDADYLDTEHFMSDGAVERSLGKTPSQLLDKLRQYIQDKGWLTPTTELNKRRCDILQACMDGGEREKGLFTLTVPTGGGKTAASMAFALRHATKHGMDRVIYVIPYTSIIEQTAGEFRKIFGEENVVEHHSNASYEIDEDGDSAQYRLAKATENWDAPIIVTTAVQFFESIYSNRPSKCRKLHSIANSVVIFDEAQMLPTEHLRPCVAAIAMLVENFYSTTVLCTATQPALNDLFAQYAPNCAISELCPNTVELFKQFRRVTFANIGSVTADTLAERLSALPQVLCIVNNRKSAQEIYKKLPPEGSFHLSTLMYPAHRRTVLAEIRQRLQDGLPCRVVSTSLIEAGVDVDFPAVYRELAGLDSILQAAGRCNREGRHNPEESIVTIFEGLSVTPQLQQINIGATKEILHPGVDPAAPETVNRYFSIYRSLMPNAQLDKFNVVKHFSADICGCMLPFRTVAEQFHLINNATKIVYIPIDAGAELVQRFRNGERSRTLFRKLGQYSVSIYHGQFKTLRDSGKLEMIDEDSAILTDVSQYIPNMGLAIYDDIDTSNFLMI